MSIAYSFSKEERSKESNFPFLTWETNILLIDSGSRGRPDSPSPDMYDPSKGMKIVKEQSPEWT